MRTEARWTWSMTEWVAVATLSLVIPLFLHGSSVVPSAAQAELIAQSEGKAGVTKPTQSRSKDASTCVGMGCGEEKPACIGLGCGETERRCIGRGCEAPPASALQLSLRVYDREGAVRDIEFPTREGPPRVQRGPLRIRATVSGLDAEDPPLYRFAIYREEDTTTPLLDSGDFTPQPEWTWSPLYPDTFLGKKMTFQCTVKRANGHTASFRAGPYLVVDDELARRAFQSAFKIFTFPRCLNCHTAGASPTQGDDRHLHQPSVTRSTDCSQCHGNTNGTTPGSPPGALGWRMPPEEFSFVGKSVERLCTQLKDPAQNGGRTLDEIREHVFDDIIIRWAWHPGPGRTPAPGEWGNFVGLVRTWVKAGHACPEASTMRR